MTDSKRRTQRIVLGVIGSLAVISTVIPALGILLGSRIGRQNSTEPTTTSTAPPVYTIKPLPVRPVVSAFVTTPDQCPPPAPAPPDQPIRICDINRTAVYELEPEAMQLQLTKVDSYRNPLTDTEVVQMSMTTESSQRFAQFTAERVGQQVAFIRAGSVVWGPKIGGPIDGQVLQLSGDLTPEQATEVARVLRDET